MCRRRVAISVATAANDTAEHFHTPTERGFNAFALFTIQANLMVGVTMVLLVLRPVRKSPMFSLIRLISLEAIVVTSVVYFAALSSKYSLISWNSLGNQLVHTVVPILTVVGWLVYGPRGLTSRSRAAWSLAYPVAWLVFTLVRGAYVHWYPYPFLNVSTSGYGGVLLNCLGVAILWCALAAGAIALDRRLGHRASRTLPPARPGADSGGVDDISQVGSGEVPLAP
jgi:hypothetical protein